MAEVGTQPPGQGAQPAHPASIHAPTRTSTRTLDMLETYVALASKVEEQLPPGAWSRCGSRRERVSPPPTRLGGECL